VWCCVFSVLAHARMQVSAGCVSDVVYRGCPSTRHGTLGSTTYEQPWSMSAETGPWEAGNPQRARQGRRSPRLNLDMIARCLAGGYAAEAAPRNEAGEDARCALERKAQHTSVTDDVVSARKRKWSVGSLDGVDVDGRAAPPPLDVRLCDILRGGPRR